jgi:branched-chain amino acid transport system substrate-binding protein
MQVPESIVNKDMDKISEKTSVGRSMIHATVAMIFMFLSFGICEAQQTIRIGCTVSLSGPYTQLSYMMKNGYELWAKEVNERGGILGKKIELIFYDDRSDPDAVGQLYEKLITEDRVDLVLSPYGSSLTAPAIEVTEKHKYIMLAAAAASGELWDKDLKYAFGIFSAADRYFIGFLDLAARQEMKNVGVVFRNNEFNVSAAAGVKRWVDLFGLKLVFFERYADHEKELPEIMNQIRSSGVECLVFCGNPPDGYFFIEQLKAVKFRPPALAISIIPSYSDFYARVGPFAEGIFGPSQWEPDESMPFPGTSKFIKKFLAQTGEEPSYHACSAYSVGQILEKSILSVGGIDQEKIRNYIAKLDTVTIMGRFKVDEKGRQIGHNPILIQWQNGVKEIVYPTKLQTAPAIFLKTTLN